jgi:hypothetical protein
MLPKQLQHALGEWPAPLGHPALEPEQPVEALDQALAGPHPADLGLAGTPIKRSYWEIRT